MTLATRFPLYTPSLSFSSILLIPSLLSFLCSWTSVEGSPLPNATAQWLAEDPHRSKLLTKRITSIFPHTGAHSITQNTVHVIAAVIGIVGAGLLMVGFLIYLKRKRRLKKASTTTAAASTTDPSILKPSFVPTLPPNDTHHYQYHHHHRREPSSSSNMSQFHVFQSDFYSYEQSASHLSSSQLLIPGTQPSCPRKPDQLSINDTLPSPPPYKP